MKARPEVLALVEALERLIDRRIEEKFEQAGATVAEHTSIHPPAGASRRSFNEWCRSGRVRGAQRDGRIWRCTAQAWREARARSPEPPRRAAGAASDIDQLLTAAGFRQTRRSVQ